MARIVCLAALFAALLAPTAQAGGPTATARALDRQMNKAGAASGAYVVDLDTGQELYARAPDVARMPASVNKLYTTSAALLLYGAEGQLTTEVLGATEMVDGVVDGNLYLRGGGDPSFSRAEARGFARVLAGSGLTEVTGRVVGDESRFDALRGGPASNFATSFWVGPLSGLPFNHGKTLGRNSRFQREPAGYAAERFERELERAGVRVRRAARAGVTPEGAVLLGEWASPRMSVLARHTNRPSDNYMAETLLKDLGSDHGVGGTTAGGTEIARREAATFGAYPTMVDGSGLSRGPSAGRWLSPTPPEPHHAARRRRAARRHGRERAGGAAPHLARRRRRVGHALRPHARHVRAGPLPGQDRHARRRLEPGRVLHVALGRADRVRDPDVRQRVDRAPAPEQDGRGTGALPAVT
jgi:serine-type D-Ala-D-Ala carboxypeptidase/endopeptidase (penicillin-binding protein 4)